MPITATTPPTAADVLVAGGGLTGVTTALLLARAGHRVDVIEADPPGGPRRGVPQATLPHVMLPRWTREVRAALPDLIDELAQRGSDPVNLLHLQPAAATGGWRPGDERFETVAVRRRVLEAALAAVAERTPGLRVHTGERATGLLRAGPGPRDRVIGLATTRGERRAGLVVDALGRRTPVPGWWAATDPAGAPPTSRRHAGFVYLTREFVVRPHAETGGTGGVLTHHDSCSVLTLPQDAGTFAVGLVASPDDPVLRRAREPRAWSRVVACSPAATGWVPQGDPVSPVKAFATGTDVGRRWVDDDGPLAPGLVAIGDAWATTSPVLGRGATLGLLQALALLGMLADAPADPAALTMGIEAALARDVLPTVEASWAFAEHRGAEMAAEVTGSPYTTDDPAWGFASALQAGARHDPVLARASSEVASLLAAPFDVLADQDVLDRVVPLLGRGRDDAGDPRRADFVRAAGGGAEAAYGSVPAHQERAS